MAKIARGMIVPFTICACMAKIYNNLTKFAPQVIAPTIIAPATNALMPDMICIYVAIIPWIASASQLIIAREVPGSNLLAASVVPLGKALYPHCLVPRKGLKAAGPLVTCSMVS